MFTPIAKEVKEQILSRVKNDGVSANQAAIDAGVSPKTVYGWLSKRSLASDSGIIEINRLKRENKALCELIGKLFLELSVFKKGKSF